MSTLPCQTVTVEEAARILGISRGSAFRAVHRSEIPSIRIGRRLLVPMRELRRLLEPEVQSCCRTSPPSRHARRWTVSRATGA